MLCLELVFRKSTVTEIDLHNDVARHCPFVQMSWRMKLVSYFSDL